MIYLKSETRRKNKRGRDDNDLRVKKSEERDKKILEICYFLGKVKE